MKPRFLIEIAGITLLIAMVALGYRYAPDLLSHGDVVLPVAECDPGKSACQTALPGGGTVEIRFSPQPVPLMKPFQVEVRVQDLHPRLVEVDFNAVGMDMGYNRPKLKAGEGGVFSATTSLPVCVTGPMAWQATLMIETFGARIALPFRFSTRS